MIKISPLLNGTRLREDHNTAGAIIASFNAGVVCEGEIDWIAPNDIYKDINGVSTLVNKAGDHWLFVTSIAYAVLLKPGWMAITHKGLPICTVLFEGPTQPPTGEPTITHVIRVNSIGQISIDDGPWL